MSRRSSNRVRSLLIRRVLLALVVIVTSCTTAPREPPPANVSRDEPVGSVQADDPSPPNPSIVERIRVPWPALVPAPSPPVRFLARFPTGSEPKSVLFSRDGTALYVPLLADSGVDHIDLLTGERRRLAPADHGSQGGFVEAVADLHSADVFVSQMTAAVVHRLRDGRYRSVLPSHGRWPKVVAPHPALPLLAVSNWLDHTVTVIDARTGALVSRLSTDGRTPRGVAFSPDGSLLYVSYFGNGMVACFETETWTLRWVDSVGGALRHLLVTVDGRRAYISDMLRRQVLELELSDAGATVAARFAVGPNPNTIALTPDEAYLLVSSRGPNNPDGYRLPSPESGAVYIFQTESRALIATVPGGLQPTGLTVSPDGTRFAFTNFQDDTVALYALSNLP